MISYTKRQRAYAKEHGLPLVTLAVPGIEFQGPVPREVMREVERLLISVIKRETAVPVIPHSEALRKV